MSFTKSIPGTKIAAALIAALLFYPAAPAIGGESELDRDKLKSGLAARIETMTRQQGGQAGAVSTEDVRIKNVEPTSMTVDGKELQLYAVRAALEASGSQASDIMIVVDESADFQFSVQEVDTGRSPFQTAEDKLQKRDIDPGRGQTVYSGSGEHELVLASSPFCPYCRDAFEFFKENRDCISEWRVLHLSHEQQPSSSAAVWAMMDGKEIVSGMDLMEFVYAELKPVEGSPEEQIEGVVSQFMEKFPELEENWGSPEQARYYLQGKYTDQAREEARYIISELQVQATPTAYIDGVPVEGWAPSRYKDLLGTGEEKKEKEA